MSKTKRVLFDAVLGVIGKIFHVTFKHKQDEKVTESSPFYDYREAIEYIQDRTNLDESIVIDVLEAEELYMTKVGIMDGTYIREDLKYRNDR